MRFAREAWPFVLPFWAAAAALAFAFGGFRGRTIWAITAAAAGLLLLLFFRDPPRHSDAAAGAILAPADGKVLLVDEVEDTAVGPGRFRRVVTFLSAFDVHVQKTPIEGTVVRSQLFRGRKVAAFRADAGRVNEQHLSVIQRPNGDLVAVRQIAGLIARRVVCYLEAGAAVGRAQPLGLIKFGSRVDLLVPPSYEIQVKVGDRVRNGETVMASRRDGA